MIQSLWHNARKSKDIQKQIALLEMEKITEANEDLLARAKTSENAAEIEKERQAQKRRSIVAKKKKGMKVKDAASTMDSKLKKIAEAVGRAEPEEAFEYKGDAASPAGLDHAPKDTKAGPTSVSDTRTSSNFGDELPKTFFDTLKKLPDEAATAGSEKSS